MFPSTLLSMCYGQTFVMFVATQSVVPKAPLMIRGVPKFGKHLYRECTRIDIILSP